MSAQRHRAQQRRREVLTLLLVAVAGTLVLGAIPRMHVLWYLTAVAAVALVCYVGLLVRAVGIAAEREAKLAYMPRPPAPEPALALRRSAR